MGAKMDPHYNTRAFIEEYLAGRGPIYFDTSNMSSENIALLTPTDGWMGINYRRLKDMGMDFFKSKLEWIPQPHYTQGGIDADVEGATSVDGIFAAGRARNLEPGVYLGGWAISGTATTGSIAGASAGKYAATHEYETRIDEAELSHIKKQVFSPLSRKGISPKEILNEIRKVMAPYDVSILKSKTGLIRSLNRLNEIRNELIPLMAAESPHYLMKANEVAGTAVVTELYLQGSLMRSETRGGHHRVEYPEHDEKYLGWFLVTKKDGKLHWEYRPVPVERYRIKPYRFYSDLYRSRTDRAKEA